ncbi:unnamed protein product [Mytilus edulis]|uniref:C2H2-type domain-containing protein n=1 Tax=Mytilus edulis TaxID=6550 RepID=A0A8S3QMP4_MYTED|nr:unnamed protein product [Mytilus edulis]
MEKEDTEDASTSFNVETCIPLDGSFEEDNNITLVAERVAPELTDNQEDKEGNSDCNNNAIGETSTSQEVLTSSCGVCKSNINNKHKKRHLRKHEHHYSCSICPSKFTEKWSLDDHQQGHVNPLICDICGKHFTSRFGLRRHMKVHNGSSKFFRCEICNVNFFNKDDHEGHRNSKHLNYKPFKCEKCSKTFSYRASYLRHISDCKSVDKTACDKCPSLFGSKRAYDEHYKAKHGQQELICKCGKRYAWLRSYNRHISKCNSTN